MRVYSAGKEDVAKIAPLFNSYRQFYECDSDIAAAESYLQNRLEADECRVFLAEHQGKAVGFTLLYASYCSLALKPIYILYDLYVTERARRLGVGSALMTAAEQFAKNQGACRIQLETNHANKTAIELYERRGYELDTVYRAYTRELG
ncbi:GNAT family N-acetyltransferase [uncultured Umboniibacter sp.]|uniref:GNAT family N-acetyltransferase n=1 Tax=uncultured Umboniibacter sp. TaxID=1798917 RepID=UPI002612BB2B|nr:GNAT family N-acetyltransferase [uncultured Umboniibacter sp.]